MKKRIVHQWRDWLLQIVCDGGYELIKKEDQSVQTITAKNDMDAENLSQLIIKKAKEGKPPDRPNSFES